MFVGSEAGLRETLILKKGRREGETGREREMEAGNRAKEGKGKSTRDFQSEITSF